MSKGYYLVTVGVTNGEIVEQATVKANNLDKAFVALHVAEGCYVCVCYKGKCHD